MTTAAPSVRGNMGLDMYGMATRGEETSRFAYWRKHNALHGWMERLYRERGGQDEFNCVELYLTPEDLDRLEADVKARRLEPTAGFFFGSTNYTEADWSESGRQDLAFIAEARRHIAEGASVFYYSWW